MTTRIRRNYLEALERGDREALPSPVQGRGFLRLYAGYLGLSPEDLVADWEGRPRPVLQPTPPAPIPSPVENMLPSEAERVEQASEPPEDQTVEEVPGSVPDSAPVAGSSQDILVTIGETLRQQRERLGLSIDDVEKYTHIRRRFLLALENGRLDLLPSTVQCRGMLSNYATFLNLDSETMLLRFAEALQARRIERLPLRSDGQAAGGKTSSKGARPAGNVRRFLTPDLAFGAGLILVLFVFIVWTVSRINTAGPSAAQVTLPSVSEVLLTSPTFSADSGTGQPDNMTTQTPGAVDQSTAVPPSDVPTSTLGAINSDPLQVYIIAKQRTFLRVTVDNQLRFNGRLIPGNAYPFSGADRIDLLLGNAAAVQVFYNQQELAPLAGAGESASISFTQLGIQTPTPMPTATPTVTAQVTITPTLGTPAPSPTITPLVP